MITHEITCSKLQPLPELRTLPAPDRVWLFHSSVVPSIAIVLGGKLRLFLSRISWRQLCSSALKSLSIGTPFVCWNIQESQGSTTVLYSILCCSIRFHSVSMASFIAASGKLAAVRQGLRWSWCTAFLSDLSLTPGSPRGQYMYRRRVRARWWWHRELQAVQQRSAWNQNCW